MLFCVHRDHLCAGTVRNELNSVYCFILGFNSFLFIFVLNILLQSETFPVQMCLKSFYSAVLVNFKLDYLLFGINNNVAFPHVFVFIPYFFFIVSLDTVCQ